MRILICGVLLMLGIGSARASQSFSVVERATNEQTVARKAGADSAGDLLVFENPIYDAKNASAIGKDQGYCIRITPGKSYHCTWTLILPDGQITSEGSYADADADSTLIITGGSGKYTGAMGVLRLHARNAAHTEYDFRYELM